MARIAIDNEVAPLLTQRAAWIAASGGLPGLEGSMTKVFATEAYQKASAWFRPRPARRGCSAFHEPGAAADGWIDYDARHSPVTTIYGGTSEINRNNIAERHLGLPRARPADRQHRSARCGGPETQTERDSSSCCASPAADVTVALTGEAVTVHRPNTGVGPVGSGAPGAMADPCDRPAVLPVAAPVERLHDPVGVGLALRPQWQQRQRRKRLREQRRERRRRAGAGAVGLAGRPHDHPRGLAVAGYVDSGQPDNAGRNSSSAAPSSPGAGTLSVSTGRLDLVSVQGTAIGKFTLTAMGGPVSPYSITAGSSLVGHISVSPAKGSLAAGASVTITVTSISLVALNGQLTVNPGGQVITVSIDISL